MAKRNPVARTLADRCFHQRIIPYKARYDDASWLDEFDDISGAETEAVAAVRKKLGVCDDSL